MPALQDYGACKRLDVEILDMENVMKLTIVRLGAASEVTRDWSGNFAWDGLVYDYRKIRPWPPP